MEITDTGKWRLRHGNKLDVVTDSLFPRPMRFREVWKKVGSVLSVHDRASVWGRGGGIGGRDLFFRGVLRTFRVSLFSVFRSCFSMSSIAPRPWVALYMNTTLSSPWTKYHQS